MFIRSVAWCALLAELYLRNSKGPDIDDLVMLGEQWLRLTPTDVSGILEKLDAQIPEMESLFDTELRSAATSEWLIESSREVLLDRSIQIAQKAEALAQFQSGNVSNTQELVASSHRDPLTGLVDRASVDVILDDVYQKSGVCREPLSVIFLEIDKFRDLENEHGQNGGERILQTVAKVLSNQVRPSDVVGQFSGSEFVIVLPKTTIRGAEVTALRLLDAFRESTCEVSLGNEVSISLSLGVITHGGDQYFTSATDVMIKAGQAMAAAQAMGGNTWVNFSSNLFGTDL